jgi:hypothetical protein
VEARERHRLRSLSQITRSNSRRRKRRRRRRGGKSI